MLRNMFCLVFLALFCSALLPLRAAQAEGYTAGGEAIPLRGVIEGFYGKPWTQAERLDQFDFYGQKGLNTYIYAPKDDPYHRGKWRKPYPRREMAKMQQLIAAAQRNQVEFVFALSPGLDIQFAGKEGAADLAALLHKFDLLYDMGVRSFAVFFDDIHNKDGAGQARLLNAVNRQFVHAKKDVKPLFTVPTEYYTQDMLAGPDLKPYTKDFAGTLDKDILVMYTGPVVVCEGIDAADIETVNNIYGRKMAVWWNYPVTDYLPAKLALGPITGLDQRAGRQMAAFIMNPMEHAALSKLTLATGADYAANPASYDEEHCWQQAIAAQYGALAGSMQVLADHSQRMDKGWAKAGRADAPATRHHMDAYLSLLRQGRDTDFAAALLGADFAAMEKAAASLSANLPLQLQQECRPQLQLLHELALADQTALAMLQAKANHQNYLYGRYRRELQQQHAALPKEEKVRLSEKTARAFIDEALAAGEKEDLAAGKGK